MNSRDEVVIGPYLEFLWKRWYTVAAGALLFLVTVLAIVYVMPAQYRASAIIVTPTSKSVSLGQQLAGQTSPTAILQGIGTSTPLMRSVGKKNGMKLSDTRSAVHFEQDPVFGQLEISAVTGNKTKSLALVTDMLEELRAISAKLSLTMAEESTKQLSTALERKKRELADAEEELQRLQRSMKTSPDASNPLVATSYTSRLRGLELELGTVNERLSQARKYAENVSQAPVSMPTGNQVQENFRRRVMQLEYDLQVALTRYGDEAPEVQQLRRTIEVARKAYVTEMARQLQAVNQSLDTNLVGLEAQKAALEWSIDYVTELSRTAPEESLKFARALREVNSQQSALNTIRQQYEEAALQSEFYKYVWTVLQEPLAEETPTNKKYQLVAGIAAVGGLVLSIIAHCLFLGRKRGVALRKIGVTA
ncbi:MAG: Wzz/FepE/Etk N-terminal domain-containing protein [Fimbriimonadaceae bacterium]|nr:Wzz/FepE/Etk N-terminal domain-containing protein [Fimbriimonadaceae bacterium]